MIYASKIKMKPSCYHSNNLLEIEEIYLEGCKRPGFYSKADIYDFLKTNSGTITVKLYPYPKLVPALSVYNEKYVKSAPDQYLTDNLLRLPRTW